LTADGVPVICHDSRLTRTTDGRGLVSRLPFAAVRRCDAGGKFDPRFAGEKIPTLDETLVLAGELGLGVNIEIKADRGLAGATAAAVADSVGRLGGRSQGVLVSSFIIEALIAMRALASDVATGLLSRRLPRRWAELAARLGCATVNLDQSGVSPERVAAVRAAGYRVLAYTVNDPARARHLFDWGVTSVFSDKPDIILASAAIARQGVAG